MSAEDRLSRDQIQKALGADNAIPVSSLDSPFVIIGLQRLILHNIKASDDTQNLPTREETIQAFRAELDERLTPGEGLRKGRPTDSRWDLRRLVPFQTETWKGLEEIAKEVSTRRRKVSPAQIAALIIENAIDALRENKS